MKDGVSVTADRSAYGTGHRVRCARNCRWSGGKNVRPSDTRWMTYKLGTPEDVEWIRDPTASGGLTITAAIPPVFAMYATVVVPDDDALRRLHDERIVSTLRNESSDPVWWFGFLDTGAEPLPVADAPRLRLYATWQYAVVQGHPDDALRFRPSDSFRTLPDLVFPLDRSWLVSTLWDDDWRCVGGPASLINALKRDPALDTREVALGQDATPPGHVAL